MGGEIFKDSLRKLEDKSIRNCQTNISLETRKKSLFNDISINNIKLSLMDVNKSQKTKNMEIHGSNHILDIIPSIFIIEKEILTAITDKMPVELKRKFNSKKQIKRKLSYGRYIVFTNAGIKTLNLQKRKLIQRITISKLGLYTQMIKRTVDRIRQIPIGNLTGISRELNLKSNSYRIKLNLKVYIYRKLPKGAIQLFIQTVDIFLHNLKVDLIEFATNRSYYVFNPGILLILYNLLILDKMEHYKSGLNEWTNAFVNIDDFVNIKQKFDRLFHEEYCKAYNQEDRIHLIDSIANEFFETNRHYSYLNALIEFYDSPNANYSEYYFDHSQVNVSGKAPLFIDLDKTLVIKFILRRN